VVEPRASRNAPTPNWFSEALFASPVPTRTEPLRGSVASAPTGSRGSPLLVSIQVFPLSVVRHTPPLAAPA